MQFSVLASGSGGNACYIETRQSSLLIDAGLSCQEIIRRLDLIGVKTERLDAIVLTHEHLDHVKGAGPLARRLNIPVYGNRDTLRRCLKIGGNLPKPVLFQTGQSIPIKDVVIETFTKCHDAADPIGVILSHQERKLGLITDLGRSTPLVVDRLKGCHGLVIEFNHDLKMLEEGPYPLDLKRRIRGPEGHLSNQQAGDLLKAVFHPDLRTVVLAHMSQVNNLRDMAYEEAERALNGCTSHQVIILVGHQDQPGSMVDL